MRVAILTPLYPSASSPTHGLFIRDQALALARTGLDVTVLHVDLRSPRGLHSISVRHWLPRPEARHDGPVQVYRWRGWSAGAGSVPAMMRIGARRLIKVYPDIAPHIVHGHFMYGGGDAAVVAADGSAVPLVLTEHSSEYARGVVVGRRRDAVRRVTARADCLIVVSQALADDVASATGLIPMVIPNVVDVDSFPPRDPVVPSSGAARMFQVLAVGSLEVKKGFDLLIRALAERPARRCHLTLVGQGRERARLQALASDVGVAQRITWAGVVPRREIKRLLDEADAFVSSSRQETFGVAIAEALAAGVPVVATPGGPTSFVEEPYGLIVAPEPSTIAGGIARVMDGACVFDPRDSHRRIREIFGGDTIGQRLRAVYTEMLDHDPSRR